MQLGTWTNNVEASDEYTRLAQENERVGLKLCNIGEHRHSIYFLIQAMEKYVRAKIFSIVNANNDWFRNRERHHSVEDALDFLIQVINGRSDIRDLVRNQLQEYVLKDVNFTWLHNNLRYPLYSKRNRYYSCLVVTRSDNEVIIKRLNALKAFLAGIDKFR